MAQFRGKEAYLEEIRSQIRCKKAAGLVTEEIEQHIEEQKEAYLAEGEDESAAMEKALEQMGDPIIVGKQMDQIHRPRLEWKLLLTVVALCSFGILIQLSIEQAVNAAGIPEEFALGSQLASLLAGFLIMGLVYFMDYSILGKHAALIWGVLLLAYFCQSRWGLVVYDAATGLSGTAHFLSAMALFFIPLYGAILYRFEKKGYKGLFQCFLLAIVTTLLGAGVIIRSNVYLGVFLSCSIMLTAAVLKDWFGTSRIKSLLVIWGWPVVFLLIKLVTGGTILRRYQSDRLSIMIKAIINPASNEHGYQMGMTREMVSGARLIGEAPYFEMGYLPQMGKDYIITYIIGKYGILAGLLLIALCLALFVRMFSIVQKQKNPLGMFIGMGCSLAMMVMGGNYILTNLGIQILAQVNLPFVSYGGMELIVNFVLMGLMLSVFRNTNILKRTPYREKNFKYKLVLVKNREEG